MRRLAIAVLVLADVGCDSVSDLAPIEAQATAATREQLAAAQAAWDASGVDAYEFDYERVCECAGGARVTVRDGRVVRTTRQNPAFEETVDLLFETAARELQTAAESDSYAAEVRLSAGTPQIPVLIAAGTTDPRIADGFNRFTVTGFEAR